MMRAYWRVVAFSLLLPVGADPVPAETIRLTRGDCGTMTARLAGDWSGCLATVILSHGLGGDERALRWIDAPATAAGYRVLVMAHGASGPRAFFRAWRSGAEAVLTDPAIWDARAADLKTALGFARRDGCRPAPLVMGGHSMGAAMTMMEAGAHGSVPYQGHRRFDAYIAISPQGPGSWAFAGSHAWAGVSAPVLALTGTKDRIGGFAPKSRISGLRAPASRPQAARGDHGG